MSLSVCVYPLKAYPWLLYPSDCKLPQSLRNLKPLNSFKSSIIVATPLVSPIESSLNCWFSQNSLLINSFTPTCIGKVACVILT